MRTNVSAELPTSLPGEGLWISHSFDFHRSFPGETSQWRLVPGPDISKIHLVGDTGRSIRQLGSCYLLCLMLEDRGNYSKVPAQAASPEWAEKKRLEMFLCPASERVKQGHQDERLCWPLLWRRRGKAQKSKTLLQGSL